MTREETTECILVMQAHADGKEIEYKLKNASNADWELITTPDWDWSGFVYRIKPQPMKVTKKEKELMKQIWVKRKQTGHVYAILDKRYITDDFIDNHYFLDPDKQEWVEIESDSKERLRHHYNGGQP